MLHTVAAVVVLLLLSEHSSCERGERDGDVSSEKHN